MGPQSGQDTAGGRIGPIGDNEAQPQAGESTIVQHLCRKVALGHQATFWLLYAVNFVEGADWQLLPSTLRALEAEIGLSPSDLATLGLCQGLAQSISTPIWGIYVDSGRSGKTLLVFGAAAWGVLTLLLACVTDWYGMLVLRTLNGFALATLTPVSQAIIAGLTPPQDRGTYFGWCGFAMLMGNVSCALLATSISNRSIYGYGGWRVAFAVVAMLSFLLSAALMVCMRDVRRNEWRTVDVATELRAFMGYFKIGSFSVIVIQGVFGSVPWSALMFLIMFFQYIGMTDHDSAVLYASMTIALAFGNVIGGFVADCLARWSRFHGRPLAAQVSVAAGIPLVFAVLQYVPRKVESLFIYAVLLCTFGLTASWCSGGVNRPILTEVVPESGHARVISWLTALEGSSAACLGGPLVGLLAEKVFGYKPQKKMVSEIPDDIRKSNLNALAMGMLWMTILPWIICFIAFSLLHFTYKKDVKSLEDQPAAARTLI